MDRHSLFLRITRFAFHVKNFEGRCRARLTEGTAQSCSDRSRRPHRSVAPPTFHFGFRFEPDRIIWLNPRTGLLISQSAGIESMEASEISLR